MFGIHGTKSYLCIVKGYSRQGMSDKERSWFYFPVVLSRFCPVRDLYHDTRLYNIVEYQCFVNGESEKNALTTSNHQNGPCEPVKVASHRNSLVWNITSSISSSRMSMPKSDKILSAIHYWILEDVSVCSVSISCTGNMPSAFSKSWINSLPFCVHRVRITVLPFSNWEVSLPTYPFPL